MRLLRNCGVVVLVLSVAAAAWCAGEGAKPVGPPITLRLKLTQGDVYAATTTITQDIAQKPMGIRRRESGILVLCDILFTTGINSAVEPTF